MILIMGLIGLIMLMYGLIGSIKLSQYYDNFDEYVVKVFMLEVIQIMDSLFVSPME